MSEPQGKTMLYWQRVAGALVLVGLILLILPVLLTEAPEPPSSYPPEVDVVKAEPLHLHEPELQQSEPIEVDEETRDYLLGNDAAEEQPPVPEPPQPDEMQLIEGVGAIAYSVRMGVFGNLTNIERIEQELGEREIKSYTRILERDSKLLYIIYAGPFPTYAMAETAQSVIEEKIPEIGTGNIVEYNP